MYLDELCNVLNVSLTKDAITLKFNVLLNESEYHGSCNFASRICYDRMQCNLLVYILFIFVSC
jgi:hypothetical protein